MFSCWAFNTWAYKEEIQCNFAFCVAQSYGCAAAMASERSGVASVIHKESPLAYYFHCAMHCLNLSASAAVKVLAIQNAETVARKVVKMFGAKCEENSVVEVLHQRRCL